MAEPRKVPFVTLTVFSEPRKRRREEEEDEEEGEAATGDAGLPRAKDSVFGGRDGNTEPGEATRVTVRLNLSLSEPSEHGSSEFNYAELLHSAQAKKAPPGPTPTFDPNDPFGDEARERLQVEALAKKFESKYGNSGKKKRKDRMQDLIDIGFGYDETDPFIDNSEAYDELVPASLNTKLGGFYINTGTLQFRPASDSEGDDGNKDGKPPKKLKDGEEQVVKKRKRKDGNNIEEKKPRKNKMPKQGVSALNMHRPEKKKRKKLMKDSLCLAAMLRRFTREKEEMRKKNPSAVPQPQNATHIGAADASGVHSNAQAQSNSIANDLSIADLTADPTVISLLGSANESELQDLLGDLDFGLLDSPGSSSPSQRENGMLGASGPPGQKSGGVMVGRVQPPPLFSPPPLPDGLPSPLVKRIEDLRAASRQFDQEGRKKFFTLDMNKILLDIELQVQEQPTEVRSTVYSHLEAFVPCNKEALLKRLKKLSHNIQDDRLSGPLRQLRVAVSSVMTEQITKYNMDCLAKAAKQQSEDVEKNGSEDEDEEKPGKRVMGPRKKFVWDDKLRELLCTLVREKLNCYKMEAQHDLSVEDYLKSFMENEVKPLWPKGWMQARMLLKESRAAYSHLTGNLAKKKIVPSSKSKTKEGTWVQKPPLSSGVPPSLSVTPVSRIPPSSPSETICLSDSLDEDLTAPSLESISHALALLSSAAKGLVQSDSPPSPPTSTGPRMSTPVAGPTPGSAQALPLHSSPPVHSLMVKKDGSVLSGCAVGMASTSSSSSNTPGLPPQPAVASSTAAVRSDGFVLVKGSAPVPQPQRHGMTPAHRPGGNKGISNSPSPPKPRPPPTASPLLPPHQKSFCSTGVKPGTTLPPTGLPKSTSKPSSTTSSLASSPQSRLNPHPSQLNSKSPQAPHLPSNTKPYPHHQSNFITPMQATLTKSSHSSSSAIIKLTPRPPAPAPPPSSSPSSSPALPPHARPATHQYNPKGFRPPFSVPAGPTKAGQGVYSPAGGLKNPPHSSPAVTPTSSSSSSTSMASRPISSPSLTVSASQGQRQRSVGTASPAPKTAATRAPAGTLPTPPATSQLSQVPASAGSSLLSNQPPSLSLGYGMLGGLVPVSLPFQFPPLLNFTTPGVAGAAAAGTAVGNSSGFTLAQNLLKSLQSGSQAALPPHLQLAFSDANQSQGGDMSRKSH